jgi:hypothetical protein
MITPTTVVVVLGRAAVLVNGAYWFLLALSLHLPLGAYQLYGPGKARHDDHALGVYEAAGFDALRAEQALTSVFTFVLGNALGPAATASFMRKLSRADGDTGALVRAYRAEVTVIAKEFPRLRARIESPAAEYGTAPDDSFAFGLQTLLDGLENTAARIMVRPTASKANAEGSRSGRQA